LLVAVGLAGCGPGGSSRAALVGAWRSSVQFDAGAFAPIKDLEFMYVFHEDGTLTESSNYDAAPPVPPAYGVWRTVRPNEFEARYEFYATTPSAPEAFKSGAGWMPSGRGVLTERIRVSADGTSFTSTIQYRALDRAGKPAEGGGTATGRATKMKL
jgi:hypothetical protein